MGRLRVQPTLTIMSATRRRTAARLAWVGACCLSLCGCASFWDEVTSRNFSPSKLFKESDPLVVLHDSSDGNERHKALAALREPLANGGTQKDQDTILQILKVSATQDEHPLCRLAALRALGRFKDPQAAETIDAVYVQNLTFGQEWNSLIRQQCLTSLVETGGPVALKRLVLVAKEPAADASEQERQETLDRRLIAVKGLAKFKEPEATAALAYVLRAEKDIALRDRAHEAIQVSTGKSLPASSPVWESYLGPAQPIQPAGGPGGVPK
jgi:hypothetical protein